MIKKLILIVTLALVQSNAFSQKLLASWSQQNIENYTQEMYDKAQKMTSDQLLAKNLNE